MEMNFQSIADLPSLAVLGNGDYLVTVSGGQARLFPANKFSGGGGSSFTRLKLKVDLENNNETQIRVNLFDEQGQQITDAGEFEKMLLSGPIQYYVDLADLSEMMGDPGSLSGISVAVPELVMIGDAGGFEPSLAGTKAAILMWYLLLTQQQLVCIIGIDMPAASTASTMALSLDGETQPTLMDKIKSLLGRGDV